MGNKIMQSGKLCKINVEIFFIREDDFIVAYCPALDLSGYGHTEDEAKHSFQLEMKIFLDETEKLGTFEKYLLQNGWTLTKVPTLNYQPPKVESSLSNKALKQEQIVVPVYC